MFASFDEAWEHCAPFLKDALHHAGDTYGIADVRRLVEEDDAQFWPGRNAAIVTPLEQHPNAKAVLFWLAGGDLVELVKEIRPRIEAWAMREGCTRAYIIGRPGWERGLPDYTPVARVIAKELRP